MHVNYPHISDIESSMEQPTAHLRWLGPVLQQAWGITKYRGGTPYAIDTEWRDVPVVQKDASNAR